MKAVKFIQKFSLILAVGLIFTLGAAAQETIKQPENIARSVDSDKSEPATDAAKTNTEAAQTKDDDKKLTAEEQAVLPIYSNYLTEYRLGPNDIISIEVFGQCPDYCKLDLTVPPTARISYPLIREGVFVGGRTTDQIQDEITKKLDEYIIEPKVTVSLVKAQSARYSVLGKVAAPGVRVMDRKVSLYEAIAESGGVLKEGDKKRVTLYRLDAQGKLVPRVFSLVDFERGKAEMVYLNPGDQIFVPDAGFKLNADNIFKILERASIARLLFGSPF